MSGLMIVLGVIAVLVLFAVVIYNRIVALNQRADQAFADVDVQLRQRHDLIPNLVETVKGYAGHERQTLEEVIQARNAAAAAHGPAAQGEAEGALTAALGRLFALAEAYPDLKANTNFLELQRELADVENKIAAARRFFNNAVQEFNTIIQQIPGNFIAPMGGFKPRAFFEIPESSRAQLEAAPEVKF
ncbi:LemA family protein [Amphiplicatus metriothermophilus]|uniref:LemA protein n=1 Tax=Amphiplicatus metriothermophilus TaxID=1519374 RepID=A0A239PXR3_9PROT|nr:LemA family protein [Amphiplicatus metriothermophilus]MBB5519850.1 LemA protein [Amphiplicatus metriothermophilus]SNT75099.1 LemA protein [Amphiplicatus metriothermophilus]